MLTDLDGLSFLLYSCFMLGTEAVPGSFMEIKQNFSFPGRQRGWSLVALLLFRVPGNEGSCQQSHQIFNAWTWPVSFLQAPGLMLPQKALVRRFLDLHLPATCPHHCWVFGPTESGFSVMPLKASSLPKPSGLLLLHPGESSFHSLEIRGGDWKRLMTLLSWYSP